MSLSSISWQSLAAIAITAASARQLQQVCQTLGGKLYIPANLTDLPASDPVIRYESLKPLIQTLWSTHQGLIFGLAAGAVTRLIAPLLSDKATDPAIVVVDQTGEFVISLCSGHQGGADQLTRLVASCLDATPVITGAAVSQGYSGLDILGRPFGWRMGSGDWTAVSAAMAQGKEIQVVQDAGSTLWRATLSQEHSLTFNQSGSEIVTAVARIWITAKRSSNSLEGQTENLDPESEFQRGGALRPADDIPGEQASFQETAVSQVWWHPRVLWLGIGCERRTPQAAIETAIRSTLQQFNLSELAVAGVATLDLKADEVGLVKLCQANSWPLVTFPASELQNISVPSPSSVVYEAVGTPSVAEAAALKVAHIDQLLVPKQVHRFPNEQVTLGQTSEDTSPERLGQAVTVAVAHAPQEYLGSTGQLFLIGIGPGQLNQITPAAQTAITAADVVIGYSLYLNLIKPLCRPGQVIEDFPITQERQRAERAIELANWGLRVAVVSSGDCGIYGMAGLVFELLQTQDWDGVTPGVQVLPGISAIQAAASRVGAPLMHDFCAISLSDLLTPWPVIEQRLTAAAQADFVCAIYNPRSATRTKPLAQAHSIFLTHRSGQTPVALVRSAYRKGEQITLTTLEKLDLEAVDMLTTILIGNQSTGLYQNWMVTPRGYLG
ncbi:MAG: precorrin-3B C(17)-methyltransferase [Microcoleaceae cyanobacterium]